MGCCGVVYALDLGSLAERYGATHRPMADSIPMRQLRAIGALPGMVAGVVPALILLTGREEPSLPLLHRLPLALAGAALLGVGLTLMVRTIRLFTSVGEGTLAPWDATRKLVVRGVYRFVRNPMISGVMAVLLGEAALFASSSLLVWFVVFSAVNMTYLPLVEERGLARRFGEPYLEYRRNVPRWVPRLTPWEPASGDDRG